MRLRYQRGGKAEGMLGVLCIAIALLWSSATRAETRVYLLRGWFGVFSTGLAAELKSKGIKAETVGHLAWKTTVSNIIKDHAAGQSGPLVLASCRHYSARRRAQDPLDSHGVRELWVAMPRNDSGESTGAIWPLRATHTRRDSNDSYSLF
jgi:hypothetical protein